MSSHPPASDPPQREPTDPELFRVLDGDERRTLLVAALAPPPVSLDLLVAVTGASPVEALHRAERLVECGLLRHDLERGRGYYRPEDTAWVRDLAGSLERAAVERVGKALVRHLVDTRPEGIERHLAVARVCAVTGVRPDSVDWIYAAAEHCRARQRKTEATSYYRIAIQALEGNGTTAAEKLLYIDSTLGIVAARGHLMPLAEQKALLERAARLARSLGCEERTAGLCLARAQVARAEGDYRHAARLYDEGWHLAEEAGTPEILRHAALATAEFFFWQGRVRDAVARYEEVIGNLETMPSDEATLRGCATLGWCYAICGQTARGVGLIRSVGEKAERLGFPAARIYADLMAALALLESRRMAEAEEHLARILSLPDEDLGHYVLWAANAAMAYVAFRHGDLNRAFELQQRAFENSRKFGWPHHRGPWNFEYLDGLERAGLRHWEMNYDSEVERVLGWPDIYMQGVGWRYKALRARRLGVGAGEVRAWLERSQDLLRRAGARLELARTQVCLARLLLEDHDSDGALPLLREAWDVLSAEGEDLFPEDLRAFVPASDREERLIRTFVEVGNTLGAVRNESDLLRRIIDLAVRLTHAERGGFFVVRGEGGVDLVASRNLELPPDGGRLGELLRRVTATAREVVRTEADGAPQWVICSPVVFQDRVLGAFYLESSLAELTSPRRHLDLLRVIGAQVAVALENVRAYEKIAELRNRLEEETRFYRIERDPSPDLQEIVGRSAAIRRVREQIRRVAPVDCAVLITGETGVGKELVARAIHRLCPRAKGPFIPANIVAFAPELVASELFGHERGAFTGAVRTRLGRFELADGGTLFLDEVDTLSPEIQAKLLRVLQEREFERVGGTRTIRSDFRLIAATNQSLEKRVGQGLFRSDLYYRIKVFPIHVPPLRERPEDIPLLAAHFLEVFSAQAGKTIGGISERTMARLVRYPWPGNVRELRHVIERAVVLTDGGHLQVPPLEDPGPEPALPGRFPTLEEVEREHIIRALERRGWQVSGDGGAARLLGLKPTTLFSKMKRLGIQRRVRYVAN